MPRFLVRQFAVGASLCAWLAGGTALAAPVNDRFADRLPIVGLSNVVTGSNVGATVEPGEPFHAFTTPSHSVWWTWTSPITGTIAVSTLGSTFDTVVAIYTGKVLTNLAPVASDDDSNPDMTTSRALFRAYAGETYQIAVGGSTGSPQVTVGSIVLRVGPFGRPAPAWEMTNQFDQIIRSTDYLNRVVLMDFFETTCQACVTESPELRRLQLDLGTNRFAIVGAARDYFAGPVGLIIFSDAQQLNYSIGFDTAAMEDAFGGAPALPTKYIVDQAGLILGEFLDGGNAEALTELILPLIRDGPHVRMRVRRENAQLVIGWPAMETSYHLEFAGSVNASVWTTVTNATQVVNDENTVRLTVNGPGGYYRLRKP